MLALSGKQFRTPMRFTLPPACVALMVHVASVPVALLLSPFLPDGVPWTLLEGVLAALAGRALGMAPWWIWINLIFAPGLHGALTLQWPTVTWLTAFVIFALVYWSTFRTQVPLYLTHRATLAALQAQLPRLPGEQFRFLDLGCGCGGVLQALARVCPQGDFHGVESAPLPFALAWLRLRWSGAARGRVQAHWGDIWAMNFSDYDVVYAFLSPVPMPRLWQKARREMRPGTVLISNAFTVPGVPPTYSVASNARGDLLHVWRM